jgi:signal transduction histidine kinase
MDKKLALLFAEKFLTSSFPQVIFDEDMEVVELNQAFIKLFDVDPFDVDTFDTAFFKNFSSELNYWDYKHKNYYVTKEKLKEHVHYSFYDITVFTEMIDQVNEQKIKIISKSKIDQLNELIGQVSHSILNPSLIMKANIGFLRKGLSDPKQLDRLEKVNLSLERIVDFAHALRINLISKDEGVSEPLDKTLENIEKFYSEDFRIHHINFEIVGDYDDLEISPAIKYTINAMLENAIEELRRPGDDWIKLEYKKLNTRHVIEISDNGPIVPEIDRRKLFVSQFTSKTDGKHGGHSLFSANNLIKPQGGQLSYRVKDDIGTFIIEF